MLLFFSRWQPGQLQVLLQREGGLLHHLTHQGFGLKNKKNSIEETSL